MRQLESPFKEYAQEVNKTVINENRTLNEKLNTVADENKVLIQENTQLKERLDKLEKLINRLNI